MYSFVYILYNQKLWTLGTIFIYILFKLGLTPWDSNATAGCCEGCERDGAGGVSESLAATIPRNAWISSLRCKSWVLSVLMISNVTILSLYASIDVCYRKQVAVCGLRAVRALKRICYGLPTGRRNWFAWAPEYPPSSSDLENHVSPRFATQLLANPQTLEFIQHNQFSVSDIYCER